MNPQLPIEEDFFNNIGVHDAYMSGIRVDKGISIITMKLISGEVTSICFDKLERMLCNGFREGNIILDIYFEKRKDFAKKLLYDIYPIYDVNDEHYQDMIEKNSISIINGDKYLVVLDSSYGCNAVFLCRNVYQIS